MVHCVAQLVDISRHTGIIVDHTYTLKAVRGMLEEMKTRPDRFKGRRALFLHTGRIVQRCAYQIIHDLYFRWYVLKL